MGFKTQYPLPTHQFKRGHFEVVAHRGGGLERPENTLIAFDHASQISPKMILEMDVHLTKDNHLVVIHDETVDRTTNGTGFVRDKTLEDLQKLDAGDQFQDDSGSYPYRDQGIVIPSLRDVLLKYPHHRMLIELKVASQDMVKNLIELIDELKIFDRILLASPFHRVIEQIRMQRPHWIFAGSTTQVYQSLILVNMFLEPIDPIIADVYSIPEKSNGIRLLSQRLLRQMHRRGKPIFIWTINDLESMKRLMAFGVDGLVTDRPSQLFRLVQSLKSQDQVK